METALIIYLIGVLPKMSNPILCLGLIGALAGFGLLFFELVFKPSGREIEAVSKNEGSYSAVEKVEIHPKFLIGRKMLLMPSLIMILFASLIPSEKTMWLMAGGYITQEAVTSEIGQDVLTIVKEKVKEYKTEIIEKAK